MTEKSVQSASAPFGTSLEDVADEYPQASAEDALFRTATKKTTKVIYEPESRLKTRKVTKKITSLLSIAILILFLAIGAAFAGKSIYDVSKKSAPPTKESPQVTPPATKPEKVKTPKQAPPKKGEPEKPKETPPKKTEPEKPKERPPPVGKAEPTLPAQTPQHPAEVDIPTRLPEVAGPTRMRPDMVEFGK